MTDSYDRGDLLIYSEPLESSSQSTVSVDLELEREEDTLHSYDLNNQQQQRHDEPTTVPKHAGGKVAISDLFKRLKPTTSLRDHSNSILPISGELPSTPADDLVILSNEDTRPRPVRPVFTAKELLSGARKTAKKETDTAPISATIPMSGPVEYSPVLETIVLDDAPSPVKKKPKSGITARDILVSKKNNKKNEPDEIVEILSSEDENEHVRNVIQKTKRQYTKRSKQDSATITTLLITLRYKPQRKRVAELEQKIKASSASKSVSARDLLRSLGRKQEEKQQTEQVVMEVESDDASEQLQRQNTKRTSLIEVLSHRSTSIRNPISKLKELLPPILTLEQFHVTSETISIEHTSISLPPRSHPVLPEVDFRSFEIPSQITKPFKVIYNYSTVITDRSTLARDRVLTLGKDSRFDRFVDMKMSSPTLDMWTIDFKPTRAGDLLLDQSVVQSLQVWLKNSYKLLKKRTKRHDFTKNRKSAYQDLDDFIVDDYEDEENQTDDHEFTPLAILVGPSGVGKSSAVYTLVEETGGYVYEINASQARGRKDILANVKELSTTQLVHQNQDTMIDNEFQKGVILFEDVDVLFENERSFWSVIENILTISRRPILLTCEDISAIPETILDCADKEGTIFQLGKQSSSELCDYLYLAGLAEGFDADKEVLEKIVLENSNDLRKCLSELQMVCQVERPSLDEVINISLTHGKKQSTRIDEISDLEQFSRNLELLSVSNMLERSTWSFINHEPVLNEVISIYPRLFEDDLKTSPLPYELNMSLGITSELPTFPSGLKLDDIGEIKRTDKLYFSSKSNGFRVTRRGISNLQQFTPEFENDHGNSIFDILPTSAYVMDVSPVLRELARYDRTILELNEQLKLKREEDTDNADGDVVIVKRRSSRQLKQQQDLPPLGARRKFRMDPDTLLHGDFKRWGTE